jgi:hypothetical protein
VSYYHARNTFVVCARHAPLQGLANKLREAEILLANLAHALRCRRRVQHTRAVVTGWRDYRRGRLGRAPERFEAANPSWSF